MLVYPSVRDFFVYLLKNLKKEVIREAETD